MDKIRILQFPIANSKGGITQYVLRNWRHIDKTRFHFDFATMSKTLDFQDELIAEGSSVYYISEYAEHDKEGFDRQFDQILRKGKYDVVHLHTKQWKSFEAEKIAKSVGVRRIIIHAHSTDIDIIGDNKKIEEDRENHYVVREKLSERIATDFWACSEEAARFLYGDRIPEHRIRIMANAIELNKYQFDEEKRKVMRKRMGYSENDFVIGNVGRLCCSKNQGFLIRLMIRLLEKSSRFRLVFLGAGEMEYEYKKEVDQNGLSEYVRFEGFRADIEDYYNSFDVFCFPSLFEGFSIALIEAQANGLHCLVSDSISKKADIAGDVSFLPLEIEKWEKAVFDTEKRTNRSKGCILEMKSYDIDYAIKELEALYAEAGISHEDN